MPRIGLTGSFGSGKSAVADLLRRAGAKVIDADVIARQVVEPGSPAFEEIVELVGPAILTPDGQLDRAALAERVFSDDALRRQINAIIHPRVRQVELQELAQWSDAPLVVLSVALLLENGLEHLVDHVVVVTVDESSRLERLKRRSGLTEEAIRARLAAQMPQEEKAARADFVIDNSGSLDNTARQVRAMLEVVAPDLIDGPGAAGAADEPPTSP